MLKVDDYAKIRLAHRDGMGIREIARTFHHSRRKVREVLNESQPVPYTRSKAAPAPVLGSFHETIDAIQGVGKTGPRTTYVGGGRWKMHPWRTVGQDIPCRVASPQSSTSFHPAAKR